MEKDERDVIGKRQRERERCYEDRAAEKRDMMGQ